MSRTEIPVIETERLRLRAPAMADFDAYADFRGSERSRSIGGPFDRATSLDDFAALLGYWDLRGYGRWIIADKATDEPLGTTGVYYPESWPEPEIAWSLFTGAEGRGIAFEAAQAARAHAYSAFGFASIVSMIDAANTRSIALAQRLGCTKEGAYDTRHGRLDMWRHPSAEALA